jgi:hypothetical protein
MVTTNAVSVEGGESFAPRLGIVGRSVAVVVGMPFHLIFIMSNRQSFDTSSTVS